eukprot:4960035-Prymnesium_polylepis.1
MAARGGGTAAAGGDSKRTSVRITPLAFGGASAVLPESSAAVPPLAAGERPQAPSPCCLPDRGEFSRFLRKRATLSRLLLPLAPA